LRNQNKRIFAIKSLGKKFNSSRWFISCWCYSKYI